MAMVVVGTRPEIVKMAPVIKALEKCSKPFVFVHCGQHYDYNMTQRFIEELELPTPVFSFKVKASTHGFQTARILMLMEKTIARVKPRIVLVQGDTNCALASALASSKLGVPVGHVEAGLRSHDFRTPEEYNRRLIDHMSRFLFAPTDSSKRNLKSENTPGSIYTTGNTVIDSVMQHLPVSERKSTIMNAIKFRQFALVTAHREENVDNPLVLKNLVEAFVQSPIPIVYPIHPRTRKRLHQQRMLKHLGSSDNVQLLEPLGYFDFIALMKNCQMIITDSGGLQEEATAPGIRKPVIVIRLTTERPEAVETGFARLAGVKKESILKAIKQELYRKCALPVTSPFGDGTAGEKIVNALGGGPSIEGD